jgi:DNA repair exonuclease SbcCD ATPase subunit
MIDPDTLPTTADDPTVQTLRSSLEQLRQDIQAAEEALPEARQEVDRLEAELEDLEVEQYADPDVTEQDVAEKREALQEARARVSDLEAEKERKLEALERVTEREKQARQAAGAKLIEDYVEASYEASEVVLERAKALLQAVRVMNRVRRKAVAQNVNSRTDGDPNATFGKSPANHDTSHFRVPGVKAAGDTDVVRAALQALIEEESTRNAELADALE